MSLDPSMRASDDDRERVADRLRDAHAEGRLTREEFDERIDRAFAAKTMGELAGVTRDLPAAPAALQAPDTPAPAPTAPYAGKWHVGGMWAAWGTAVVISVGIWATAAVSGAGRQGFWPIWVAGPWGAVLLAGRLFGTERERPGRQDGERDHL